MLPRSILKARQRHQKAAEALMAATRKAYPVGCIVLLRMGRALVEAEVTGHANSWWYSPDEVHVVNVHTKKARRFGAGSEMYEAQILRNA